jgi:hypothetical protein
MVCLCLISYMHHVLAMQEPAEVANGCTGSLADNEALSELANERQEEVRVEMHNLTVLIRYSLLKLRHTCESAGLHTEIVAVETAGQSSLRCDRLCDAESDRRRAFKSVISLLVHTCSKKRTSERLTICKQWWRPLARLMTCTLT